MVSGMYLVWEGEPGGVKTSAEGMRGREGEAGAEEGMGREGEGGSGTVEVVVVGVEVAPVVLMAVGTGAGFGMGEGIVRGSTLASAAGGGVAMDTRGEDLFFFPRRFFFLDVTLRPGEGLGDGEPFWPLLLILRC